MLNVMRFQTGTTNCTQGFGGFFGLLTLAPQFSTGSEVLCLHQVTPLTLIMNKFGANENQCGESNEQANPSTGA